MRTAILGGSLTVVVTGLLTLLWGRHAMVPGLVFGSYATIAQVAAVAAVRRGWGESFGKLLSQWAVGMALRFAGIVFVAVAVILDRETFAPLPTAFGYLGVVVPLLFMELKLIK